MGGDRGPGEGFELRMLTLLEDCEDLLLRRPRCLRKLKRLGWKFRSDICAFVGWLFVSQSIPGLFIAARALSLDAAGVLSMGSSASLSTAMSEETSESVSESSMLILLTELDRFVRSP